MFYFTIFDNQLSSYRHVKIFSSTHQDASTVSKNYLTRTRQFKFRIIDAPIINN